MIPFAFLVATCLAQAAADPPSLLSQTGLFRDIASLEPHDRMIPYQVRVGFWSDGAGKRRWMVPASSGRIRFTPTGEWQFPTGTRFVKHFERRLPDGRSERLETRVLAVTAGGIVGQTYRWRRDGRDAELVRTATTSRATPGSPAWWFPGPNDCKTCHTPPSGGVLGVNARQLGPDQIRNWSERGLFTERLTERDLAAVTPLTPLEDARQPVVARVLSYLDAGCAYCHRPGGVAADFDARWETPLPRQGLIDRPARINLGLDNARLIAPNDPWRSMLLARVETLEPTKMPPVGHLTVDPVGARLLREWIGSLPGPPVVPPPTIAPKGADLDRPVKVSLRHDDPLAVVRFTLDGSPPTGKSQRYERPILMEQSATIRARAFREGHTRSIVAQETFIIEPGDAQSPPPTAPAPP